MGLSAVFGPIGGHSREAIGLVNTGRHLSTNPNLDERIGDFASTEPMNGSSPDGWRLSVELNAGVNLHMAIDALVAAVCCTSSALRSRSGGRIVRLLLSPLLLSGN